jgi:hypothetical protein
MLGIVAAVDPPSILLLFAGPADRGSGTSRIKMTDQRHGGLITMCRVRNAAFGANVGTVVGQIQGDTVLRNDKTRPGDRDHQGQGRKLGLA